MLTEMQLRAAIEAVLFMNHKPVSLARLQELISPETDLEEYRSAISNLQTTFFGEERGIELVEVANGWQFRTKMEQKDLIRRMYQVQPLKLTNAMLEVLAITAYNQPVTREQIDKVRGVDSSHLLRMLLDKKMLRIAGKSEDLGKPMLYGTTKEFLELFGLRDLSSLPSLRELEEMLPSNEVGAEMSEEEILAKEMENIVAESRPLEYNDLEVDGEFDEEAKKEIQTSESRVEAETNSHGSAPFHFRSEDGETPGNFDQPAEIAGDLPVGPEGNA